MRTHIVDTVCYLTKRRRLLGADCASLFLSLLFFGGILFLNYETWQRDKARQERKENNKKNGEAKTNKIQKVECEIQMRMVIDTRKFSDKLATESHLHVLRWACHLGQPPRSRLLFRVKIKTPKDFGFFLESVEIISWILSIFK
jgi:hypothetical protein